MFVYLCACVIIAKNGKLAKLMLFACKLERHETLTSEFPAHFHMAEYRTHETYIHIHKHMLCVRVYYLRGSI